MASALSENILQSSKDAMLQILPDKSHSRYVLAYQKFLDWQKTEKTNSFQEEVLLAYFGKAAETFAPSTLWSMYSMLKLTINCNHNVDISKYSRLLAFLKKKSDGFSSKKSNVFSAEHIHNFLTNAPDREYLAIKVVTVFEVCGACRGDELSSVMIHHVKDLGSEIIVRIPDSKTKVAKVFPITGEFGAIVRKYMQIRPQLLQTDRFFLQLREGKCTQQVIGKNVIAQMPKQIAQFLNLEDSGSYTGHSIRQTSTTILADMGGGIETIKKHGVWKSSTVPEAPTCKREKEPERQEELHWYDEECLAQIKLTTDMFKRFSNLDKDDKIKMLSEFSMHRVELSQKYFRAINLTNTPMVTAASINTASQNDAGVNPAFVTIKSEFVKESID